MSEELEFRRRLAEHEARFLRPTRADLHELAAAIDYRGRDSGEAVWQRAIAAGRIPASWADEPLRRFRATRAELRRPPEEAGPVELATPPTARAALLFASDVEGLREAERLARELVARFEAWGCPPAERVVWRLAGNPVARSQARPPSLGALAPAVARLRAVLGGSDRIYEPPHLHRRFQPVVDALFWSRRWQAISTSEIPARLHGAAAKLELPPGLGGRSLDELANPLEPWLALSLTGYNLLGVRREGGGARIELAAPFPAPRLITPPGRDPPRVVWSQRLTELRLACARGDVGRLRSELPLLPGDDEPGQPRLIHFAAYGGSEVLELLAEHGRLELEARDRSDRTALMLAAGLPSAGPAGASKAEIDVPISEIVGAAACEWLLAAGADAEARDLHGRTALHWAALGGRLRCAAALIQAGAELDATDHRGRTPLMLAMSGHLHGVIDELGELLLSAGADADARDDHGWTALHHLAAHGSREPHRALTRRLVERGARPSRDRAGRSPAQLYDREPPPTDGGPFDPRTPVAAGPGIPAPMFEPTLVGPLLDQLVPGPPDPCAPAPAKPPSLDAWMVWADWLSSRGDSRGELVATWLAHTRVGGRKRRALAPILARLASRCESQTHAAIDAADPLAPARPTPIRTRWTHGFMTGARLSVFGRPSMSAAAIREALPWLLKHEPLLAELHLCIVGAKEWQATLELLRGLEPNTRLRRLVLDGLPARLPVLDGLASRFLGLRSLWLIGHSKIHSGVVRWPGPTHLRLRHGTNSEWTHGNVDLELELPDLTHLDLALPTGSRTTREEARGAARTLAQIEGVQHLRLSPLAQDFAAAILPCALIPRLRSLELAGVRGSALETLVHRVDSLRELECVRVSITPTVAEQRRRLIDQLRQELPRLELDTKPGSRPPFVELF